MIMDTVSSYGFVSRMNHWIIAIAIIGMLCFGLFLAYGGLEGPERRELIGIHKAIGVLVLIFGLWRVCWRLFNRFPAVAGNAPPWQDAAARAIHWALLLGILIMPVSGITMSLFSGRPIDVFGFFTIPAQQKVEWLSSLAGATHQYVAFLLIAVVTLHIAAALKHHLIDKDETLVRMISGTTGQGISKGARLRPAATSSNSPSTGMDLQKHGH